MILRLKSFCNDTYIHLVMIPKIIHFFHNEHLDNDVSDFMQYYQAIYPNFTLKLWSLDVIEKELLEVVKEMGYEIEPISYTNNSAVLYKYIFLFKYGGMYFQKDVIPVNNIYRIADDKPLVMSIKEELNVGNKEESNNRTPDFISSTIGNEFLATLIKDLIVSLLEKNTKISSKLNEAEIIYNAYMKCDNASDIILLRHRFIYQLDEQEIFSSKEYSDIDLSYVYGIKIFSKNNQVKDIEYRRSLSDGIQNSNAQKVVWPKVSCLCISQNNEIFVRRCIKSFENQLYENKELIIIYEDSSLAQKYISSFKQENIKAYHVSSDMGKKSLGELRNISIHKSTGDYIMQWDDDDIYDPHRIIESMISLLRSGNKACVLDQFVMYDEVKDQYSFSKKRKWEGSILVEKETIVKEKLHYPNKAKGEDTPFYGMLEASFPITVLKDPWLYMYVTHHNNTFDYNHHDLLVDRKFYFFKRYLNSQTLRLKYFRALIMEKID